MKNLLVTLLSAVVVSSCAGTSSQIACVDKDWSGMGYDYAAEGKSVRAFDRYREQCGDSLEDGAMSAYLDGYAQGLVEHCTYEKGYDRGLEDKQLLEVCPMEMRAAYVEGYKEGHAEHGRTIWELEGEQRRHERYFDDWRERAWKKRRFGDDDDL